MLSTVFALPSLHTPPTVVSHAALHPPEPTSSSSSSPRSLVRPPDERLTALAAAHRDLLAILGTDEAAIRARVAERRHTSSAARHPRSGRSLSARFFSKTVPNHLPIRAHSVVPDSALFVASDRMSRQLRGLPPAVIERLCRRGAALHLIGSRQVTTDLPEHRHLRGVRGAVPGEVAEDEEARRLAESVGRDRAALSPELERRRRRLLPSSQMTLDERSRGMGGLQASCGEENLLAPEADPRYRGRCVLSHELSHTVMDHGLPAAARAAITACWEGAWRKGLWRRPDGSCAYAASAPEEYFAELSMWYWGSHGEFVDDANRLPTPGPWGLARYDPDGFALVGALWSGRHASLAPGAASNETACKLRAVRLARPASDPQGAQPVEMEVDNSRGETDLYLAWINGSGAAHSYGVVAAHSYHVQRTFSGHVWEISRVAPPGGGEDRASSGSRRFRISRHSLNLIDAAVAFGDEVGAGGPVISGSGSEA